MTNIIRKEIITESLQRAAAFKSELTVVGLPYRFKRQKFIGDTFYTFKLDREYMPRALNIWRKICVSIPSDIDDWP